jgi:hypothetical protein
VGNGNKQLLAIGLRAEGIIFKLHYQPTGSMNSTDDTIIRDKITVRFPTQTKEWITAVDNGDAQWMLIGVRKDLGRADESK